MNIENDPGYGHYTRGNQGEEVGFSKKVRNSMTTATAIQVDVETVNNAVKYL